MDELARSFARAHGCPPGCPDCERAWNQVGIPEALHRWDEFLSSSAARRLVAVCERAHRSLPRLSPDDVTQFCLEEALYDLQAFSKFAGGADGANPFEMAAAGVSEGLNPESEAMQKAREFSMGRAGS